MTRISLGAWIGLAFACAFAATWPFRGDLAQSVANATMNRPLVHVRSWRMSQGNGDIRDLIADHADLLVVDAAAGQTREALLTPADVARLKVRADGTRRLVVARLAVGELSETSTTSNPADTAPLPAWLGERHCTRPDVRRVRYWLPDWKKQLFRLPGSQLERLIAAGFDGVYLGGVDVFASFETERADARSDMIQLVQELAAAARAWKPGFIVIAQNAETLLTDHSFGVAIDGVVKESFLYNRDASGVRNSPSEIKRSTALLRLLQKNGKPIFAIEYLQSAAQIDQAAVALRRSGFVPAFETRGHDAQQLERNVTCSPGTVW